MLEEQNMERRSPFIAPSLLAANAACYAAELDYIEQAGADYLHIDVMDGHFVPNLSFGPHTVMSLRPKSRLFFDIHLMIENPLNFVNAFIDAGADAMTVHPETADNLDAIIHLCQQRCVRFGLALKPETSVRSISEYLKECDILLMMSVHPGFGGQQFMPEVLDHIREAVSIRRQIKAHYKISVDGGINQETGKLCMLAGADILVAGSAIFDSDNPAEALRSLKGM